MVVYHTRMPKYSVFLCLRCYKSYHVICFSPRRYRGLGFRLQGLGLRVQGLGFRVQGLGFRRICCTVFAAVVWSMRKR